MRASPSERLNPCRCPRSIVKEEGVLGLWKGVGPTCGRATVLAAAELSTYDEVKTQLLHRGIFSSEGLPLTVCTAFVSGYVSTVASSPFDVVADQPLPRAGATPAAALHGSN